MKLILFVTIFFILSCARLNPFAKTFQCRAEVPIDSSDVRFDEFVDRLAKNKAIIEKSENGKTYITALGEDMNQAKYRVSTWVARSIGRKYQGKITECKEVKI